MQGEVQEMTVCILSEQIFLSEVKIFLLWPKEYNSNLAKKNIFILTKRCFQSNEEYIIRFRRIYLQVKCDWEFHHWQGGAGYMCLCF